MASVGDLASKLDEHKAQLKQVEDLLKGAPADASLLKLRDDLFTIIKLTEDMSSKQPGPESSAPAAAEPEAKKKPKTTWKVGDRCRAPYEEDPKPYPARIESIALEVGTCMVTYLQYGNTGEVPLSHLKPFVPAPHASLAKGTAVSAVWSDGLMYNGIIDSILPNGLYRIKFAKYKQKEDVPGGDLVLRYDANAQQQDDSTDVPEKPYIPDSLQVLPSDTPKVKEQKKKRLKRLKYLHKQKRFEAEARKRKNTWQNFQKGVKRGKKKRSMFASPDSVDGKVGVVGSGRGMTEFKNIAKHDFSHLDEQGALKTNIAAPSELM